MTISSGFFNSVNHDRLYDAEQFGSIFDGVINDGVYGSVGEAFRVSPNTGINDSVIVGTGRAWFMHIWVLNDARFSITLNPPNLIGSRIDAVVIDVDRRDSVRKSSIEIVEGVVSSSTPSKPSLINEELHKQYPIAYITVPPGNSGLISGSNIEYAVGGEDCPWVTGPLEVINSDNFFDQMNEKLEIFKETSEAEFNEWFQGIKDFIDDLQIGNVNLINSVDDVTIEWLIDSKKIQVKDHGITRDKLSYDLQALLEIMDTTGWGYTEYYDYVSNHILSSDEETRFFDTYFKSGTASSWTAEQISNFYDILKNDSSKNKLWNDIQWSSLSLADFRMLTEKYGSSKFSSMIGKQVTLDIGDYGSHSFRVIGINHDTLSSGGKALLTLQSTDIVTMAKLPRDPRNGTYSNDLGLEVVESLYSSFSESDRSQIKQVIKAQNVSTNETTNTQNFSANIWLISMKELNSYKWENAALGTLYDYWSSQGNPSGATPSSQRVMQYSGTASKWFTRDIVYNAYAEGQCYIFTNGASSWQSGSSLHVYANSNTEEAMGIVPCFCI